MISEEYAQGLVLGTHVKELIDCAGNPEVSNDDLAAALREFVLTSGELFGKVVMLGLTDYFNETIEEKGESDDDVE
jgi:hypothetical protein